MRGAKVEALEQLKIIRSRLITVLSELGEPIRVPIIPECDAEEFPERAMEYSMDSLRQFKTEYETALTSDVRVTNSSEMSTGMQLCRRQRRRLRAPRRVEGDLVGLVEVATRTTVNHKRLTTRVPNPSLPWS